MTYIFHNLMTILHSSLFLWVNSVQFTNVSCWQMVSISMLWFWQLQPKAKIKSGDYSLQRTRLLSLLPCMPSTGREVWPGTQVSSSSSSLMWRAWALSPLSKKEPLPLPLPHWPSLATCEFYTDLYSNFIFYKFIL